MSSRPSLRRRAGPEGGAASAGPPVIVSGAGPAGLLVARSVLDRCPEARVEVLDRRGDPRTEEVAGFRAYSLGLNIRGYTALQHWDGLWDKVAARGLLSSKFLLHIGGFQLQLRANPEEGVPTLLISRNDLCAALLEDLEQRHGGSGRLCLRFGTGLESVDLSERSCVTSSGETLRYADLVGADGVNSAVRQTMAEQAQGFACDVVDLPGSFKVWVTECPEAVDDQAVNLMEGKGYSLFSIPRADGRICTIISWNSEEEPSFLQEGEAAIADRIAEDVPKYGRPPASAVAQLRNQRPSRATTVRTSSYCDLKGRALLLGDAAHSTGGTLGQGCNSALADAVELDKLLAESASGASVVERVGARFSQLRQPEGLALWKLLQLPPRGPLRLPYLAAQAASGLFSRLLPGATAPVQSLLSETTTDYAEIVARNALWVDAALEDAPGQGVEVFE